MKKPKATWVGPEIEAEIAYSTLTENGLLREAVFKGLREDRAPPRRARVPAHPRATSRRPQTGVPRENILQLLPDAVPPQRGAGSLLGEGLEAGARASGAQAAQARAARKARPSITWAAAAGPRGVHRLTIEKREGGEGTRLWVDDLAGLLGLVEIGAVELHAWNATVDDIEHPDMLVFDLDPGEGVDWEFVIETALRLRRMLKDEGLEPWPKLTGGKGVHLMAPLDPDDRPRPGASLREADRAAPRRNRTEPVYALLRAGKARRAHLHRLPAERPRHHGHRCLVAASARGVPDCGPGELAPGRERDSSRRLYDGKAAAQIDTMEKSSRR